MALYRTKQGDTWDSIAHTQLGDVVFTDQLMQLNGEHLNYYTFPTGVVLELPDVEKSPLSSTVPWKQVTG